MTEPQTVTPERQQAAAQIGQIFNSMHQYLSTLQHKDETGRVLTSAPMEYARKAVEEASFWAIKHVLMHGVPKQPAADSQPAAPSADAPPAGADALPPTTPQEAT